MDAGVSVLLDAAVQAEETVTVLLYSPACFTQWHLLCGIFDVSQSQCSRPFSCFSRSQFGNCGIMQLLMPPATNEYKDKRKLYFTAMSFLTPALSIIIMEHTITGSLFSQAPRNQPVLYS